MKFRFLLLLSLFIVYIQASAQDIKLPRSMPQAENVAASGILDFLDAVEESPHEMHSLMILRHGNVIAEGWWQPYSPELKHTMYSVSKSFTATAIGFAVQEGMLTVEDKVADVFQGLLPATVGTNLSNLRIKDLLTMSVGHEKEYTGEVVRSDDWVKTFLGMPIAYTPGTKFLYNTAATYMLSAIIEKITGDGLMDYLTSRLFEPLGIQGVDWELDPNGMATGGYGLRLKTEDMAKFGQLFLQKGKWGGRRILNEAWVEEASTSKILQDPTAEPEAVQASDWLQGYAYQMWRSRHDSYRADGAFGQYILVLPEVEAVIAITSETSNMQDLLNLVWKHLLPAFDGNVSAHADGLLQSRLSQLAVLPEYGVSNLPIEMELNGNSYSFGENSMGLSHLGFEFNEDECVLTLEQSGVSYMLSFGREQWLAGETDRKGPYLVAIAKGYLEGLAPFMVYGSYSWKGPSTLQLELRYIESPHTEIFTIDVEEGSISLQVESILNRNAEKTPVEGVLIGELALEE